MEENVKRQRIKSNEKHEIELETKWMYRMLRIIHAHCIVKQKWNKKIGGV